MFSPISLKNSAIFELRSYLLEESLYEVQTPSLSQFSGIEPFIEPLMVSRQGDKHFKGYLTTSPEFNLKKLLSCFYQNERGIFEISQAFRNEKKSNLHHLEFTMAEWYVQKFHYLDFIQKIDQIIARFVQIDKAKTMNDAQSAEGRAMWLKRIGHSKKASVKELFQKNLSISLKPETNAKEYQEIALSLGIDPYALPNRRSTVFYEEEWSKTQLFQVIFDQHLIPALKGEVWHIYDFPPFLRGMASLSRAGWAERVECYVDGIEVSNGYQELYSTQELKELWEYNNAIRKIENRPEHPQDELLVETTPKMKGVSGISLGIERSLIALKMVSGMKDFIWPGGN